MSAIYHRGHVSVSTTLRPEELAVLRAQAEAQGIPLRTLVRRLLQAYVRAYLRTPETQNDSKAQAIDKYRFTSKGRTDMVEPMPRRERA